MLQGSFIYFIAVAEKNYSHKPKGNSDVTQNYSW